MNAKAKLMDGKGNLVGSGKKMKGNIFYLDLSKSSCFIAQVEESWLWHKRLCHVNFDNLIKIRKKKRVRGIPSLRKPDMGLFIIVKFVRWERQVSKVRTIILKRSWS